VAGAKGAEGAGASLSVVWDFDSAVGQVNASFPYHFRRAPLEEELEAVGVLREATARLGVQMTFATVGLAAEDVPAPFGAHDELCALHGDRHEIASHAWRHEWLPHLSTQQLRRSLVRSKLALEQLIGAPGAVTGFVPPFNRPMTWLARGNLHPGDRWAVPPGSGATLDTLIPTVARAGYGWIRAGYGRRFGRPVSDPLWAPEVVARCVSLPHHHNGFDGPAHDLLDQAVQRRRLLVLSGHPAGLFRQGNERRDLVIELLEAAARRRDDGSLEIRTMSQSADAFREER
jgi:peptidoglycan/xylan/chitin deacetylase (PgdA/CDA1 family)